MSKEIKIEKITLVIKDIVVELTLDELKELKYKLDELFILPVVYTYTQPYYNTGVITCNT